MEEGKLIVVEGACDGIGKTTQYMLLNEHLKRDGKSIVTHHFPSYGTYQGKAVEMYLNGKYGQISELSPYFINSLYANDRSITWHTNLKQEFEQGKIVLLDRYTTSSLIYQSAQFDDISKKKDFINYVCDFEYEKLGLKRPDNVIFLHAPFDLVAEIRNARKQNGGVANDIYERDLEFMKKVYESAMFIADYLGWDKVQCDENGKIRGINDIHNDVYRLVKGKL